MVIKSGKREFTLTEKDRILFNGNVYILITQEIYKDFCKYSPTLAKSRVEKMIKSGDLVLAKEKYKSLFNNRELDLYKIAEARSEE